MTEPQERQPTRMLAILLGASTFPYAPKLAEGRAFYLSAADVKEYLLGAGGLGLARQNVLSLFDDSRSPSEQLVEVMKFLRQRIEEAKSAKAAIEDLLIYYVGHGLFTRGDQAYCLAVRTTNEYSEGATSIRAGDLAGVLKEHAAFLRRYLILDCCFAASINKEFQSGALEAARTKLQAELPGKGTALLCSSNARDASLAPMGLEHTMFTNALLQALREGREGQGDWLSFSEIGDLTKDNLRTAFPDSWVRPEVHSPDQREGDIAALPLFPNAAYRRAREQAAVTASQETVVSEETGWPLGVAGRQELDVLAARENWTGEKTEEEKALHNKALAAWAKRKREEAHAQMVRDAEATELREQEAKLQTERDEAERERLRVEAEAARERLKAEAEVKRKAEEARKKREEKARVAREKEAAEAERLRLEEEAAEQGRIEAEAEEAEFARLAEVAKRRREEKDAAEEAEFARLAKVAEERRAKKAAAETRVKPRFFTDGAKVLGSMMGATQTQEAAGEFLKGSKVQGAKVSVAQGRGAKAQTERKEWTAASTYKTIAACMAVLVVAVFWGSLSIDRASKKINDDAARYAEAHPTANAINQLANASRANASRKMDPAVEEMVLAPLNGNAGGSSRFVVGGAGGKETVLDSKTGLMWSKQDYWDVEHAFVPDWNKAMYWAKTMNAASYGGYSDWMVPSIKQLRTLNESKEVRHLAVGTFAPTGAEVFWASNTQGAPVASYMYFAGALAGAATSGAKTDPGGNGASQPMPISVRLVRVADAGKTAKD